MKERFHTQLPVEEIQRHYFLYYMPNFWLHKAKAIRSFIDGGNDINYLKFQGDHDENEVILNQLKMELHMMVFHSAEALFFNIFAIVFAPEQPWIWISRCDTNTFSTLIRKVAENGLSSIQAKPEEWLRPNLYPSIENEKHKNYEKSKVSARFVCEYVKRLAKEYIDHFEYNSYKHGLRCFPGLSSVQAINENTKKTVYDSGDTESIYFLEFQKVKSARQKITLVKSTIKSYNYKIDFKIIYMNTVILSNLFYAKKILIQANGKESKVGYYFVDDWKLEDIFHDESEKGKSLLRFTH